jgi:DNA-binding MarR family transcriptional regulator
MSLFNPSNQVDKIEGKITVALERISEAFRVLLWQESKKSGLSPIQIQIMVFLLNHNQKYASVSYLALEFNMTKATISDSVKVLEQKNMIQKKAVEGDTRSQSLHLTKEGKNIAQKSSKFANHFERILSELSIEKKNSLFLSLQSLIKNFQEIDIITTQRMCFTCKFYERKNEKHRCHFLNAELKDSDIRIDCNEHISNPAL